jgi:hypothetical protein
MGPHHVQEQEECIRETKVLAALKSPHIIKYYDSFLEMVRPFMLKDTFLLPARKHPSQSMSKQGRSLPLWVPEGRPPPATL